MKHQTPDSMKFKKLQRRLGVSKAVTIGTLELLWIATQKNAPCGDIGRFTNEEIAIECEWEGDPDALVDSLVESGWLDASTEHRLIIHDWPAHAPRYVHGVASRKGGFVGDYNWQLQSPTTVDDYIDPQPNVMKPNVIRLTSRYVTEREKGSKELWDLARPQAKALHETCDPSQRRLKDCDYELAWKWGVIAALYPEIQDRLDGCLSLIASKVKSRAGMERPWGYAMKALAAIVKEAGLDFDTEWKAIEIPPRKEPS